MDQKDVTIATDSHTVPAKRSRGRPRGSVDKAHQSPLDQANGSDSSTTLKRKRGRPSKQDTVNANTPPMDVASVDTSSKRSGIPQDQFSATGSASVSRALRSTSKTKAPSTTVNNDKDPLNVHNDLSQFDQLLDPVHVNEQRSRTSKTSDSEKDDVNHVRQWTEQRLKCRPPLWSTLAPAQYSPWVARAQMDRPSALNPEKDGPSGSEGSMDVFKEATPHVGEAFEVYMGPTSAEEVVRVRNHSSVPLHKATKDKEKEGVLLNAGGFVYSLDWAPSSIAHLGNKLGSIAVSASLDATPRTKMGDRVRTGTSLSSFQVWDIWKNGEACLQQVCCFDRGKITCLRWAPFDDGNSVSIDALGMIACAFQDGTVQIFVVPNEIAFGKNVNHDATKYLQLNPVCIFDARVGVPLCLAWFGVDLLAVAYSDGNLAVWSLQNAIRAEEQSKRPLVFVRVSRSSIVDLAWDSTGRHIYTSGYDGSLKCTPVFEPNLSVVLQHFRDVGYTVAYQASCDVPIFEKAEDTSVRVLNTSGGKVASTACYSHLGRILVRSMFG